MDYNDEVLPERDVDALTTAYMNLITATKGHALEMRTFMNTKTWRMF